MGASLQDRIAGAAHNENGVRLLALSDSQALASEFSVSLRDVQLAALETSTRCLILTGGYEPSAVVLARATEVGVPVVVVEADTLTTVQSVEQIFGKTSLHQAKKVSRFFNILQERFDIERFYNLIGIQA